MNARQYRLQRDQARQHLRRVLAALSDYAGGRALVERFGYDVSQALRHLDSLEKRRGS